MGALIGVTCDFRFARRLFDDEEEFNERRGDVSCCPVFLFCERVENGENNGDKDYNNNSTEEIILYFFCAAAYGNIYIRARADEIFSGVIQRLKDKCRELKILKNLGFCSGAAVLGENEALAENGILESCEISIEID